MAANKKSYDELSISEKIEAKKKKIKRLFREMPPEKRQFAEGIINQFAVTSVTLERLADEINNGDLIEDFVQGAQKLRRESPALRAYNTTIAYPVFDETGRLTAIYPINAQYFELLEYMGTLYCRFTFATGATYICEYSRVIHVRRHFLEHDIFGDGNKPLDTALKTANTLNQSMSKFAELVAVIRGILKVSNAVKTEDLNRRRDDFIRDNLRMENNGAGVMPLFIGTRKRTARARAKRPEQC